MTDQQEMARAVGHIFEVDGFSTIRARQGEREGWIKSQSVEALLLLAILIELKAIREQTEPIV